MADLNNDKLVEIDLGDNRFVTNDRVLQGRVKVSKEIADDLDRRMKEQASYQKYLYNDNGRQVGAGTIVGNGN